PRLALGPDSRLADAPPPIVAHHPALEAVASDEILGRFGDVAVARNVEAVRPPPMMVMALEARIGPPGAEAAQMVHQIAPDRVGAVGEAGREGFGLRIEQDLRGREGRGAG